MPTYIEKCNCKGSAPERVRSSRHYLRPRIIGELLKDRAVPRYLIGPCGYGKSSIAFEYAQLMFEFEHVFWLGCDSPCFLRDLDRGDLLEAILAVDSQAKLIVCDDLPALDPDRMALFEEFLEGIASRECEVLITCIPSMDDLLGASRDAIVVDACGLLLGDDEVQMERERGNALLSELSFVRDCDLAPAIVWGDDGAGDIVEGIRKEDLPSSARLLVLGILLLGRGKISSLAGFANMRALEDDLGYLERRYPYLGIDVQSGCFNAIDVPCEVLRQRGHLLLGDVVSASLCRSSGELLFTMADSLVSNTEADRATSFLRVFASKEQAGRWLLLRGWSLIMAGEMLPVLRLAGDVRGELLDSKMHFDALCAWAAYGLERHDLLSKLRRRVLRSNAREWGCRCACAVAGCAALSMDEANEVRGALSIGMPMMACDGDRSREVLESAPIDWDVLLYGCCLLLDAIVSGKVVPVGELAAFDADNAQPAVTDPVEADDSGVIAPTLAAVLLERVRASATMGDARRFSTECLVAAWSLKAAARAHDASSESLAGEWVALVELLLDVVEGADEDASAASALLPRWVWVECALAIDRVTSALPHQAGLCLSPRCTSLLGSCVAGLSRQATAYSHELAERDRVEAERVMTLPDSPRYDQAVRAGSGSLRAAIQPLRVKLFGGFDILVGDGGDEPRLLTRTKSKVALAMLVLSKGREVSKERMTEALWPASQFESRQRNFYVVWSDLRRALTVDSRCPYLVRTQTGYRVDRRYVSSDLDDFDQLCHELLFGSDDMAAWQEMFDKASGDYAEDLLPGMCGSDFIDSMRARCRSQLVDGLVAASMRMGAHGEHRGAIWFAREALRRDPSREDAYISMMESQLSSDQRGAALETYFDCRRQLSDQLGIDPSPRIMSIYRSIIEVEEVF